MFLDPFRPGIRPAGGPARPFRDAPMNQALRLLLAFAAFLSAITFAHGLMNLDWFKKKGREQLIVGHLPVT